MLLVLVLGWGSRLGWHVGRRSAGHDEDPRYADLLRKHGENRDRTVWTFVYLPQMLTLYVVSLSVQVAMFINLGVGPLGWIGVARSCRVHAPDQRLHPAAAKVGR